MWHAVIYHSAANTNISVFYPMKVNDIVLSFKYGLLGHVMTNWCTYCLHTCPNAIKNICSSV